MDARHVRGAARFHLPVFCTLSDTNERLSKIRLSEHQLLVGGGELRPDRITGVYGIAGQRNLLQMATRHGISSKRYALTAEFHYTMRLEDRLASNKDELRSIRRAEQNMSVTVRQWVHTNSISRAHKDDLAEILLSWLPGHDRTFSVSGKPADPADILLQHPELAQKFLDAHKGTYCLVYPARLDFDRSTVVWVGTMRADPARIFNPWILHLKDAEVCI